jgi:hypothetical protein
MEQFIKLNSTTNLVSALSDFSLNHSTSWIHKNAFDIAMVPLYLAHGDSVFSQLITKFKAVPIIFRMQPWQFYRFHIDAARYSAINVLISGKDSQTYFGADTGDEELLNITELNYDDNCLYLLNTRVKHGVINRQNTRYMFSLGFNEEYREIKKFVEDHRL